jgi:hypothetical protein
LKNYIDLIKSKGNEESISKKLADIVEKEVYDTYHKDGYDIKTSKEFAFYVREKSYYKLLDILINKKEIIDLL